MQEKDIHPAMIGIWWPTTKAPKPLVDRVKETGFRGIPRVPVYDLQYHVNCRHRYLLADGHKRRDAASKAHRLLPCAVYKPGEVIDTRKDRLDDFEPIGKNHFEEVLLIYWTMQLYRERLPAKMQKLFNSL